MRYKFVALATKWFDKVNGNTYHSVKIADNETGNTIYCPFQYGYGEQYKHTALIAMVKAGMLPEKYNEDNCYSYEMENNYPILWFCYTGLKRECIANGTPVH